MNCDILLHIGGGVLNSSVILINIYYGSDFKTLIMVVLLKKKKKHFDSIWPEVWNQEPIIWTCFREMYWPDVITKYPYSPGIERVNYFCLTSTYVFE